MGLGFVQGLCIKDWLRGLVALGMGGLWTCFVVAPQAFWNAGSDAPWLQKRVALSAGNVQRWQVVAVEPKTLRSARAALPKKTKPSKVVPQKQRQLQNASLPAAALSPKIPTQAAPALEEAASPQIPTQAAPALEEAASPQIPTQAAPTLDQASSTPNPSQEPSPIHQRVGTKRHASTNEDLGGKQIESQRLDAGFRLLELPLLQAPLAARRAKQTGWAVLEISITPQGNVANVRVLAETPQWGYGKAARQAYAKARFSKPTVQKQPVRALLRLTVRFKP